MKKIFLIIFVLVFLSSIIYLLTSDNIFAQTPTVSENFSDRQHDQQWSCLHIDQDGPVRQNTLQQGMYFPESPIRLTGNCNGSSCDAVICAVPSSAQQSGNKCHDRDLQSDQSEIPSYCYEHCWKNGDTNLSDEMKHFFATTMTGQAGGNHVIKPDNVVQYMPKLVDPSGSLIETFNQGSFTDVPAVLKNAHRHAIYLIFAAPIGSFAPTIIPLSPFPTLNASNATQQLGLIQFSQTSVQVGTGDPQQCTIILWDPYGRVFDAQSLEPLGEDDAIVTLLDKDGNRVNLPTNDDSLDIFGLYNILVIKDDNYKLKVTPKTNHSFEPVNTNPLYKDLYEFIYKAGDPAFYEKASDPKRVDIPLKPIGAPYSRPIEIGKMTQKDIQGGTQFIIKVTHPLSKVKVISNGKVLIEGETDKSGIWQAVIKKSLLSQYGYGIEISKNPKYFKTGNKIRIEDKVPDNSVVRAEFNPLLEYLEGYAFDKDQKIIPKAKVNVILKMDKSIYYQTVTDDSGFFTIYSKDLPFLDYYLEFEDPLTQKKITQTTTQFIKNNDSYIKLEDLDLMRSTKNNQPIINPATGNLNDIIKTNDLINQNNLDRTSSSNKKSVFNFLLIVIMLVTLALATLGMIFYIKKSRSR